MMYPTFLETGDAAFAYCASQPICASGSVARGRLNHTFCDSLDAAGYIEVVIYHMRLDRTYDHRSFSDFSYQSGETDDGVNSAI